MQGKGREKRHHGLSPRATGDSAIGPRDRGSQPKVVAADLALDWVLQEIVQHARLTTSATGAFIGLVRANKIVCQALSGCNAGEFVAYLNRDRRMVDSCLRTGSLQRCRDSEASEELDGRACRYLGARSVVLVPISDETTEEKLGIFGVLSPQIDAFSNANLAALQTLSRRIADAMEQVDQCAPVSSGVAAAQIRPNPGNVLPIRARLLRAIQRPVAVSRRPSLWVLGILAVVLLVGGWTLTRAINQRAMHASAKTSAPVSQAASVESAAVASQSASSSSASPLSNKAGANPGQSPAVAAPVKPVTEPAPAHKAIKKIPARSELHLPDLEIENALDDASPGSLVSESVDAFADETSTVAAPRPEETDKKPASTNADSTPASPVVVPEKTALEHVTERVEPHVRAVPNQPLQGTAIVDVVVRKNGQVEVVRPVSGDPRFLMSAVRAVRRWRFTPLVRNGQSVSFESQITFDFALP